MKTKLYRSKHAQRIISVTSYITDKVFQLLGGKVTTLFTTVSSKKKASLLEKKPLKAV